MCFMIMHDKPIIKITSTICITLVYVRVRLINFEEEIEVLEMPTLYRNTYNILLIYTTTYCGKALFHTFINILGKNN